MGPGAHELKNDSPLARIFCQQLQIRVPFVTDDLSTRKTADWYDLYKPRQRETSTEK
jgi:hypothetical protein